MTRRNTAEQFFNDAINTIRESQNDLEKTISGYTSGFGKPPADIIENSAEIIVKADLPGFRKENIKVDIGADVIEIIAQYQEDALDEGSDYIKKERKYGEVKRILELPAQIKIDSAKAEFAEGILQLTLPKLEKPDAEKTEVKID